MATIIKQNRVRDQVHLVEDKHGNLIFQIPSAFSLLFWEKKQKYISFGAKSTFENRQLANTAKEQLQHDLELGTFNPDDLLKYKHPSKQGRKSYSRLKKWTLLELFDLYCEYKKPQLSEGVYQLEYCRTTRSKIAKLPQNLDAQLEIRNTIFQNPSFSSVKKLISRIHNCLEWAVKEELLPETFTSKFKDYQKEWAKAHKNKDTQRPLPEAYQHTIQKDGIKAWTPEEMNIIIEAFHNRPKSHLYQKLDSYAYLIEFLFLTGCRHGEAFALTWGKIASDFSKMRIDSSYHSALKIRKCTKTGKTRTVPLCPRVQEILKILKPDSAKPTDVVFQKANGKPFRSGDLFQKWYGSANNQASGVICQLIQEGKLSYYLDPYSTRRTFVSRQVRQFDVSTVAAWVGDNPETILKHYACPDEQAVPI